MIHIIPSIFAKEVPMCPASAAENMISAIVKIAQEKSAAGNYPEAIQAITPWLETIENHEPKVRATFGMDLAPLYCLRANAQFELSKQGNDPSKLQLAQEDVAKATNSFDEFYTGLDPAQQESVKASIRNVISTDDKLRNESMASILQLKNRFSHRGGAGQARRAEVAGTVGAHAVFFAVGLVLWGIVAALVYGGASLMPRGSVLGWVLIIPGAVLFFVLIFASLRGWNWLADRGIYGERLKAVIVIILMMTMIGLVPIMYWSGKGVMSWYYQRHA
jgi:hypothetical protein